MTDKKVTCYTCRFCKIYSHGGIYCAIREKGGKCYAYNSWESQEDVLDKIRADIIEYESDCRLSVDEYPSCKQCTDNVFETIYRIIDKCKADQEDGEKTK